ncbi:MAG: hypothetical protein C4538_04680 [Nitrospiraceae bacterium]|nr:MAG: hypothetical protein C4538_04680 [Nitrospiraceae bacterium]
MKAHIMNRKAAPAAVIIAVSAVVSLLTIILHKQSVSVCSYDGEDIMSIYEVNIKIKNGGMLRFCSVYCAEAWFRENSPEAASVTVTDELTGEKLDASLAIFVESDVVSVAATNNRIHVFKDEYQAREHAKQYNGRIVDNPFSLSK